MNVSLAIQLPFCEPCVDYHPMCPAHFLLLPDFRLFFLPTYILPAFVTYYHLVSLFLFIFMLCSWFPSVLLLLYRLLTNPTTLVNLNIACSAHLTVTREKYANGWFRGRFRAVHHTTPPVLVFLFLDSHFFLPLAFQYRLPPWPPSSLVFSA